MYIINILHQQQHFRQSPHQPFSPSTRAVHGDGASNETSFSVNESKRLLQLERNQQSTAVAPHRIIIIRNKTIELSGIFSFRDRTTVMRKPTRINSFGRLRLRCGRANWHIPGKCTDKRGKDSLAVEGLLCKRRMIMTFSSTARN